MARPPLLEEMTQLMTGAMGAAQAAGEEARTAVESRVRGLLSDMDLVTRDEFEAVRAIAREALGEVAELRARFDALEADRESGASD